MIKYTRQQILNECSTAMKNVNVFYREDFLNRQGKTSDTDEYYTEVIAKFVIDHIDELKGIEPITREEYTTGTHNGVIPPDSDDSEENIAKQMFNQCKEEKLACIGKIIDYQTPLKRKLGDKAGKIDLLSDDGKQLIILELKKPKDPSKEESMLRCVLEGYTYLRRVDKAKLLNDFSNDSKKYPANYGLSTSPLVPKKGRQWQEMQEDRPKLKELMKLLDIKPYYYRCSETDGKFIVEDK